MNIKSCSCKWCRRGSNPKHNRERKKLARRAARNAAKVALRRGEEPAKKISWEYKF